MKEISQNEFLWWIQSIIHLGNQEFIDAWNNAPPDIKRYIEKNQCSPRITEDGQMLDE